ncbi:MAG: cache domain-containing protein [Candidatus Dojkabacteria bacterium]
MSKKNFIIITTFLLLIPISIVAYLLITEIKTRIVVNSVEQYKDIEQSIGKQVASVLSAQFGDLQDKLVIASNIPEINNGDTTTCNTELAKILSSLTIKINNLGRVGEDKLFKCTLNPALIGVDASKLGSYINDIFNDPEHKTVLSRVVKVPNVEGSVVAVHVPVLDTEGNFTGTLGGAIYFSDLKNKFLNEVTLVEGGYVAIVDDNGTILSHPDLKIEGQDFFSEVVQEKLDHNQSYMDTMKLAQKGEPGTVNYLLNGQSKVGVLTPVEIFPGRFWVVNVTLPLDSIKKAVNSNQVETLFTILLLLIIIFILLTPISLLIYLILKIFNPITKIINSMSKVADGSLDEQVKYDGSSAKDEIFILTNSFNQMVQKLKKSYTILEESVSKRTTELQGAKNELEKTVDRRTVELEEAKKDLEKKVEDRTKELEDKVSEAEGLNKIAIDREMKMIEMKKELDALKAK